MQGRVDTMGHRKTAQPGKDSLASGGLATPLLSPQNPAFYQLTFFLFSLNLLKWWDSLSTLKKNTPKVRDSEQLSFSASGEAVTLRASDTFVWL